MTRVFTAILARNEAGPDRFLGQVISRAQEFSDGVLVLDDGSTDGTAEFASSLGAIVKHRNRVPPAWGAESSARKELWEFGCEFATEADDWLLINDADMELVGDVRALCGTKELNGWSFILFDLWNEQEYRSDEFWRGHRHARPWLFAPNRVPQGWKPVWPERGIHPGHAPPNFPLIEGIAPPDEFYWLHRAYQTPELRRAKHQQYLAQCHLLSDFEKAHAESILAT